LSAHQALRRATRGAHDRVDAAFSTLNLADPADYATFLTRHAAAFLPVEQALTEAGADRLIADWDALRRGSLLSADMADLGIHSSDGILAPAYPTPAAVLGGAYVLEGSRLGGAMLRRMVGGELPRRFLDSIQPPGRWRTITAALDQFLGDPHSLAVATMSALETFALFEIPERDAPSD
jgi:heme oxygenase